MLKLRFAAFGVLLATATMPLHAQQGQPYQQWRQWLPDQSAARSAPLHTVPYDFNNSRWKDLKTEFRSPCDDDTNTDPDCVKHRQEKAAGPHPG